MAVLFLWKLQSQGQNRAKVPSKPRNSTEEYIQGIIQPTLRKRAVISQFVLKEI